jgi:ferredoxin-NADP reductase
VAGGIGITPLRALFETLPAQPGELTLLYRASSEHDLVFRDELEAIAGQRGARLRFLPGSRQDSPLDARYLLRLLPDLREHDVYLCGPPGMTAAVRGELAAAGVSGHRIHEERFAFGSRSQSARSCAGGSHR